MSKQSTRLVLAAILLCSACSDQAVRPQAGASASRAQLSTIRWDEAMAPAQVAKVSNGTLIMMR